MSSLETYQQEKRSGLYEDTVSAQDASPLQEPSRPAPMNNQTRVYQEPDLGKEAIRTVLVGFSRDLDGISKQVDKVLGAITFFTWILAAFLLISFAALFIATKRPEPKPQPKPQAKIVIKKKLPSPS